MEIKNSAYRHGEVREDIVHAVRNALRPIPHDEGLIMLVGPARDGRFLEVALNRHGVVIHAMTARKKFL